MPRVCMMIGCVAVFLFSTALTGLAQPTAVTGYEVTSIGTLQGHNSSSASELDEHARIVGRSGTVPSRTVLWVNGELFTPTVPPGGETGNFSGISPTSGLIVGSSLVNDRSRPAAWRIGVGSTLLQPLPGGVTSCYNDTANDAGWMVGGCDSPNRSALWPRLEAPIDLGSLGNQFGNEGANDINAHGEIVGRSYNAQRITRPYLWRNGQMIDIGGEPTDAVGFANGINNHTEVVGYSSTRRRGFYWFEGRRTDLLEPYPLGSIPKPQAINDAGLVVGSATNREGSGPTAVAWEKSQQVQPIDLNDHIPIHPDVTLITADDVNEAGQIAAYGELASGQGRGFLVTPYLFEMSDPVPGRAGTMNTITVTGLQPNQRVHLVWGTREGAQKIHGACAGGTLLIRDPQALPAVRADANGVATITINVPLIARGRTIRMQAVAPIECQISHTVTWTFE